jgi:gas vesicle protein
MGFFSGVIAGVAIAAGAAAWYMSRSGERVREQYRVEQRLGELGDQLEVRTREIQSTVNAQLAEMRAKGQETAEAASSGAEGAAEQLDAAAASAAEAAAAEAATVAAEADAMTARVKKAAKGAAENATD